MSVAIENLQSAQQRAMARQARGRRLSLLWPKRFGVQGVTRNIWSLPSCQSLYLTEKGTVVVQGSPLVTGMADVPPFSRDALITALRIDQAGNSTFPEFLLATMESRCC